MRPRAVIFDAYGTLLEISNHPVGIEKRWSRLFQDTFHRAPEAGFSDTAGTCRKIVARVHEEAKRLGIAFPEVVWPDVLREAVPDLGSLSSEGQDEFVYRHSQLTRTTSLFSGVAALLPRLRKQGALLGIASNAQAYTLREMRDCFSDAGLDWTRLFEPGLNFWSFQHGFSKPDPHVFQILRARLAAQGIRQSEILMVGDRLDNDIEPARAHGWQTWWLHPDPGTLPGGTWRMLDDAL